MPTTFEAAIRVTEFYAAFARVKPLVADFRANGKFHLSLACQEHEIPECRYCPHIDTALAQNLHKFNFSHYEDPEKFAENKPEVYAKA
jgi:hypothetical protein